jgi:hypothetical protein
MLGHDKLANYYKTNFALMQHHKYSLYDIEHMMPWERFIYIDLLKAHIQELEQQRRDQAAANKFKRR